MTFRYHFIPPNNHTSAQAISRENNLEVLKICMHELLLVLASATTVPNWYLTPLQGKHSLYTMNMHKSIHFSKCRILIG